MKDTVKIKIPKGWRKLRVGTVLQDGDRRAWSDSLGGVLPYKNFFSTSCAGLRIRAKSWGGIPRLYIRKVKSCTRSK